MAKDKRLDFLNQARGRELINAATSKTDKPKKGGRPKSNNPLNVPETTNFTEEEQAALIEIAEKENRSKAYLIRQAVLSYYNINIENKEK